MLAEVATFPGVFSKAIYLHFVNFYQLLRDSVQLAELSGKSDFAFGDHSRLDCVGDHVVAQRVVGDFRKERRIYAGRKCDGDAVHFAQEVFQFFKLLSQAFHVK